MILIYRACKLLSNITLEVVVHKSQISIWSNQNSSVWWKYISKRAWSKVNVSFKCKLRNRRRIQLTQIEIKVSLYFIVM